MTLTPTDVKKAYIEERLIIGLKPKNAKTVNKRKQFVEVIHRPAKLFDDMDEVIVLIKEKQSNTDTFMLRPKDVPNNITVNALWNKAEQTTYSLADAQSIKDIIDKLSAKYPNIPVYPYDDTNIMANAYIITNRISRFGATCAQDETTLKYVADKIKTDKLVIIPSSVNECIVFDANGLSNDDIQDIIKTMFIVNLTEVGENDTLAWKPTIYTI